MIAINQSFIDCDRVVSSDEDVCIGSEPERSEEIGAGRPLTEFHFLFLACGQDLRDDSHPVRRKPIPS